MSDKELIRRSEHIVCRLCAQSLRSERCSHGVLADTTNLFLINRIRV
jgi:hypothetical protein